MLNHGFSSILLGNYSVGAFFAFFIKVSKHLRKCVPKWFPKGSKIELGAPWGSIFEVLGAFWTMSNFDEFWRRQKVSQKSENGDTWRPKASRMIDLGRPGGMRGGTGGSFRGVEVLVKLVKFRIGQKVLGVWNWAV